MNFRFDAEEEAFRQDIRDFLKKELPTAMEGMFAEEFSGEVWEFTKNFVRKLAAKKWLALGWPIEYGGLGASEIKQLIYREEVSYYRAPGVDMGIGGISWVGPSLLLFGTEEQKKKFLPPTAAGEQHWCSGYSEPEAGSDLAGLKCQARKKDGYYVLNGSKIWTSAAHIADWCYLAARTDPVASKHRGISLLIVDLHSPGVTIRPIPSLTGVAGHNEVFFDDVKVPAENLVGEENNGWFHLATSLTMERGHGITCMAYTRRLIDDMVKYVKEHRQSIYIAEGYEGLCHELANAAVEAEVGRLLAYRAILMGSLDPASASVAAIAKVLSSELFQRVTHMAVKRLGLYGQLRKGSKWAQLDGEMMQEHMLSVGATLAGGTSEIQRSLIAMVGLGLPRAA